MKVARSSGRQAVSIAAAGLLSAVSLAACGSDNPRVAVDVVCEVDPSEDEIAEATDFFEGETITFVVDRSPGGGYDQYARLVAPYLADELNATVVVENQEGAGGLVAVNSLAAKEATGLDIAIFNAPGLVPATLADYQGVRFAPAELTWIGRVAGEPDIVVVPEESPLESFEDVIAGSDLTFGSSGPGAADYVNPSVLIDVFDLDAEVVSGYDGASEIELGVLRGDVDAMTGSLDSRLPALNNGTTRALAVLAPERLEEIPDVPTVFEFDLDEASEAVMEAHIGVKEIGRPIVAPPGLDAAKTYVLREALATVVEDPELLAEADQIQRPIDFLPGEEQCGLAQQLLEAPDDYIAVLEDAYRGGDLS